MSDILLLLLLFVCIGCGLQGMARAERVYEPLLPMASVFIGFVWIQLHGLWRNEWSLPHGSLSKTCFMALLCILAFWWGYSRRVRPLRMLSGEYDTRRLLLASLCLTLFGAVFFFLISRLPEEMVNASQWSGLAVAYRFFAQTVGYGFAIACLLWARFRSRPALVVAIAGGGLYLDRIVLAGRRADAAEFFFIIVLALMFGRGWRIPRLGMLLVMIFMVLGMNSTGQYRTLAEEARWYSPLMVGSINFVKNMEDIFWNGGEEMKNALYIVNAYDETGDFDYGASYWNQFIFNYVPAQLVGAEAKTGLQIEKPDLAAKVFGHRASTGSTMTGLADSFGSFWYFGAFNFAIVGFVLRKIWNAAKYGSMAAQLLYMLLITKALHVITHHTDWFFFPWIHMAIFFFPFLFWARLPARLVGGNLEGARCQI